MKCIFCKGELNPGVVKIMDGGRISVCKTCCSRLVDEGFLGNAEGGVVLQKPLMQVLSG